MLPLITFVLNTLLLTAVSICVGGMFSLIVMS